MEERLALQKKKMGIVFGHLGGSRWATVYEDTETIPNEITFEGKIPLHRRAAAPTQFAKGGRVATFELSKWYFTVERPQNVLSTQGSGKPMEENHGDSKLIRTDF